MAHTNEELKDILQLHIGNVYRQALTATGSEESAKSITRKVMLLLKRADSADMAITDKLVTHLTEDAITDAADKKAEQTAFEDGVIAGMPRDFDSALSSLSKPSEPESRKRRSPDTKAAPVREKQEYVDPFKPEPKREKKSSPMGIAVALAAVAVLVLLFLVVMLLMRLGLLPGASSPFVTGFTSWFNANVFILF